MSYNEIPIKYAIILTLCLGIVCVLVSLYAGFAKIDHWFERLLVSTGWAILAVCCWFSAKQLAALEN